MDRVLIVSTNWVGDAVMSMPAVQLFREENPDVEITLLAKPGVMNLWKMHPAINEFQTLGKLIPTIEKIREDHFDCAYILPNSFRSAFIPFMARISKVVGARGDWRRAMLTNIIRLGDGHQQFEAMNILGVQGEPPAPQLNVPEKIFKGLEKGRVVTLLPGAARGPSKRWPPERFVELAKKLIAEHDVTVVLSGGPDDAASCVKMATAIGPEALNFSGKTTIPEWAALLKRSDCVVANDSGGMHLAAAVGTPVVGIFGVTDPKKTGPLGRSVILQKSKLQSREVKRNSEEAIRALSSIDVDEVCAAVLELL